MSTALQADLIGYQGVMRTIFANKPVEHLLGAGITAQMLNDDCLGRTLDWLYAHDLTKLFAGIASRARRIFEVKAEQIHVDTTSFSVSGAYSDAAAKRNNPLRLKSRPSPSLRRSLSPLPMATRATIATISSSG